MTMKRYRNNVSGQVVEVLTTTMSADRFSNLPRWQISYGDTSRRINSGLCRIIYDRAAATLYIDDIWCNPERSGFGHLLLIGLVNFYKNASWSVSRVVADGVSPPARHFYLKHGFHPTNDVMEKYKFNVPLPADEMTGAAMNLKNSPTSADNGGYSVPNLLRGIPFRNYHIKIRDPSSEIYQASNGQSVTRNMFNYRIEAGRNSSKWEVATFNLELMMERKSSTWVEVASR